MYCWFEYGTHAILSTGSSALSASSRKWPGTSPRTGCSCPTRVMAFTCTPDERPCVASKRFEMNWNSAIESRLKRGWPPVPSTADTCWPSMFSWNSRDSPPLRSVIGAGAGGVGAVARREQRQRHPVAALHRQLLHLARVDVAADGSTC